MEISGDVTDAGRTTNDKRTREDRATQPMDAGWLRFAKDIYDFFTLFLIFLGLSYLFKVFLSFGEKGSRFKEAIALIGFASGNVFCLVLILVQIKTQNLNMCSLILTQC